MALVNQLQSELATLTNEQKLALIEAILPDGLHLVSDDFLEYTRQAKLLEVDQIEKECIRYRKARWEPTSAIRKQYAEAKRARRVS